MSEVRKGDVEWTPEEVFVQVKKVKIKTIAEQVGKNKKGETFVNWQEYEAVDKMWIPISELKGLLK